MNIPLLLVIAVTVGAVVFGVMTLVTGGDPGLRPAEPDSRARPLPGDRPLLEGDVGKTTFDLALRGYRMDQVDQTLRRLAYDIGYKTELIQVLEAEITALREGRIEDANTLAKARLASLTGEQPEYDDLEPLEEAPTYPEAIGGIDLDAPEPVEEPAPLEEPDAEVAAELSPESAQLAPEPEPEPEPEPLADKASENGAVKASPRKGGGGRARKTGVA
jgi:DivIVA domain-containing protein